MNSNEYMANYMIKRYHRRRKEAIQRLGGQCTEERCKNRRTLNFHHQDPKFKEATLANMFASASEERLNHELEKCRLVCSRHHRQIHSTEHGKTIWRYKRGCRCDLCRLAYLEYQYSIKLRKNARRPHGTRARYLKGCKCNLCQAANTKYSKELRLRSDASSKLAGSTMPS